MLRARGGPEKRLLTAYSSAACGWDPRCTCKSPGARHRHLPGALGTAEPLGSRSAPGREPQPPAHLGAELLQLGLVLGLGQGARRQGQALQHLRVRRAADGVVGVQELHLLAGRPEVADEELPREEIPGGEEGGAQEGLTHARTSRARPRSLHGGRSSVLRRGSSSPCGICSSQGRGELLPFGGGAARSCGAAAFPAGHSQLRRRSRSSARRGEPRGESHRLAGHDSQDLERQGKPEPGELAGRGALPGDSWGWQRRARDVCAPPSWGEARTWPGPGHAAGGIAKAKCRPGSPSCRCLGARSALPIFVAPKSNSTKPKTPAPAGRGARSPP